VARGQLRVYLGAAPGVGKTYKMLEEGRRRQHRGTDVVVGFIESHGRPTTEAMIGDLEVVPRKTMSYKAATFTEMDIDAVLARRPQVALVDELAHTNVPGSRNAKRWQDIDELLDAGITVLSTVNIQHLESLNDVVEQITKQLNKLVEVVKVVDLTDGNHIERELMLVKVRAAGKDRDEMKRLADIFRGRILDVTDKSYTIELTGTGEKLDAFLQAIEPGVILAALQAEVEAIEEQLAAGQWMGKA